MNNTIKQCFMGIIDIIIVLCFLPAIYFGIKNGLVKQLISLATLILGIWLSIRCADIVSGWILRYVELTQFWVKIISFIVIFFGVALLLNLLGNLIEKIIKITLLGWLNKLLGIVLSIVIISIILAVVIFLLNSINQLVKFLPADKIAESNFYTPLLDLANSFFPYLKNLF